MKLIRHVTQDAPACVATIGNFDGLHLGHQTLLKKVQQIAQQEQLVRTVISFEPLPNEHFQKDHAPKRICGLRDKVRLLEQHAVDQFACFNFETIASLSADDFIHRILLDGLNVKHLIVGDDFRFGQGREGNFKLLQQVGKRYGMQVTDTKTITFDDERISSTRIREHLAAAELTEANELLGQPYQISGRIRHGDKLGRTIGFPTLNVRVHPRLALRKGVYAVRVHGLNHDVFGVANLGTRPTVKGTEMRFEVHVFNFDQQVYGQYIQIEPIVFLRDEQKFAEFAALKQQIQLDATQARNFFQLV